MVRLIDCKRDCVIVKYRLQLFIILSMLSACAGEQVDVQGTLAARDSFMATENGVINSTAVVEQAELVATYDAQSTALANVRDINQLLSATIEASNSPVPPLEVGRVPPPNPNRESAIGARDVGGIQGGEVMPLTNDEGEPMSAVNTTDISGSTFTSTGITDVVDGDGCPENVRNTFSAEVERLFYTFRVTDLPQGTTFRLEWALNGDIRTTSDWQTPQFFNGVCLWLVLNQGETVFTPGEWTATLYVGDTAVINAVNFTLQ